MSKIDIEQQVGITETGEIAFNLEAFNNLRKANIIITKRLTNGLIEKLLEHKDKCILHLTVTGMGGSKLEPFVPTMIETKNKFDELISLGFPIKQVVLRIDPIIPTSKGVQTALKVIKLFKDSGIKRIRWSCIDMYNHVKDRFKENGIKLPFETFHANKVKINALYTVLESICYINDFELESCGEPGFEPSPCISEKDLNILGLSSEITLTGSANQRDSCSCPENKVQLIREKPGRCKNSCLYCYWK